MPEDISARPAVFHPSLITEAAEETARVTTNEQLVNLSPADVVKRVRKVAGVLKARHPQEEEAVERVADFSLGPIRLGEEALQKSVGGEIDPELKELGAVIQQSIVHGIYYVSTAEGKTEEEEHEITKYASSVYRNVINARTLIEIFKKKNSVIADNLEAQWSGIRTQLAIIRALSEEGYKIFIPNYTNEEKGEIATLDRRGIDFIAVSPYNKRILLIDAKSTRDNDKPYVKYLENFSLQDEHREVQDAVELVITESQAMWTKNGVAQNAELLVHRGTIHIPTEARAHAFVSFPPPHSIDQRADLAWFGRLQKGIKDDMLQLVRDTFQPTKKIES